MIGQLNTYRADFRANLKLAIPIMAGQLGQITVNIADNVMVGDLGSTALAALALALSLYVIFYFSVLGIGMAVQPLVSESDGAKDSQGASFNFKHSLLINILAALVSIAFVELSLPLIHSLGQDPAVVDLAIPYLRINMYSLIPFMIFYAFRGLSEGLSETRPPMVAMLIGNVINIVLNYMLIYGNWGAPELGVEGAAIGTFFARLSMLFMLIILIWRWEKRTSSGMRIWQYVQQMDPWKYSKTTFKKVLRLGLPISLQMLFEIVAFAGAALLMGVIGEKEQAAHQITINAISASFMICMGISIAASIRVGNFLGSQERDRMRAVGISSVLQVILFMSIAGILFMVGRSFIPSLYIEDPEVISIASTLFIVAALFQLSDGIQVTIIGALRGLQDIVYPTVITFIAYLCIGLPFSYLAAFTFDMGYIGIWVGLLIGLTISATLNLMRFWKLTSANS